MSHAFMHHFLSSRALVASFAVGFMVLVGGLLMPAYSYAATPAYTINLLTPVAGDVFQADTLNTITWERGEGDAPAVSLFFSDDGGATWEEIVRNTSNDGSYPWMTAHIQSHEVFVRIASTDLATELAVDVSGPFSVYFYDEDNTDYWDDNGGPREYIPSDIDGLIAGDYLQTEGVTTTYAVDEEMTRRPFYDEETYYTYEDSSDAVVDVSLNTFHKFEIGAPMLPQAGVVLIKTPSSDKVYWASETFDGVVELHWITSEAVATEMFGFDWNEYVLDVDSTLFTRYEMGGDIEEAFEVDLGSMKRVGDLHE